ncbi:MAG: AbrB/MazE/SpoVT family DNA-binding domain-containing protein, partial [Desulfosudaceae bacterium]
AVAPLTNKGQITIPKAVRQSLGLTPGDKLEFIITGKDEVVFKPVVKKVDEVYGALYKPGRKRVSVREMNEAIKQKIKENAP